MLHLAFYISHSLNTKGHAGSEKNILKLYSTFTVQMHQFGLIIMQRLYKMSVKKPYPHQIKRQKHKILKDKLYT